MNVEHKPLPILPVLKEAKKKVGISPRSEDGDR
jgi:hypothetical protein